MKQPSEKDNNERCDYSYNVFASPNESKTNKKNNAHKIKIWIIYKPTCINMVAIFI